MGLIVAGRHRIAYLNFQKDCLQFNGKLNCLLMPLLGDFLGVNPLKEFRYCRNPRKDRPWVKTRRNSHQTWNRVTFCDPVTRGSHRPGDPVDPLTQYYNGLQMST